MSGEALRLGFIGAGKMAQALAEGFIKKGKVYSYFFHIFVYFLLISFQSHEMNEFPRTQFNGEITFSK